MDDWSGWIAFGGLCVLVGFLGIRWYVQRQRAYARALVIRNTRMFRLAAQRAKAHELTSTESLHFITAVSHFLTEGVIDYDSVNFSEKTRAVFTEWVERDYSQF